MSGTANTTYVERAINITVTLGKGTFGQTGFNTVKLTGLRAAVTIDKGGFPSMDRAEVRIYGVSPSVMNAVTTLGVPMPMARDHNAVLIEAGDAVNGMAVVYHGTISKAWQDYSGAPETFLSLLGWGGLQAALDPVAPLSFPGTADVATIMSGLAIQMGWAFENNGVQVKIASPYLAGTALEQAHSLARAANIEMYADTGTAPITLAIWPKTQTRGGTIPLVNAASGLIGYPTYSGNGMSFRCLYNPNIRLGGRIKMESSVGGATAAHSDAQVLGTTGGPNGVWYVIGPLSHDLSAQMPDGPWFTDVNCALLSVPATAA